MFKKLFNVLRPSNFLGYWDITAILPVLGVCLVIAILLAGIGYVVPDVWLLNQQPVVVAVRTDPVDFMPEFGEEEVEEVPDPYCLGNVVVWDNQYYVPFIPGFSSGSAVEDYYEAYFDRTLGYVPDDIRVLSADGSTDSKGSHYIEAENGKIILDGSPCILK